MFRIIIKFLFFCMIVACSPANKAFKRGDYHNASLLSVEKLIKKPNKSKELSILFKSYPLAQQTDLRRLDFLKTENKSESWGDILTALTQLEKRQEAVMKLSITIQDRLNVDKTNYNLQLIEARENVTRIYYDNAVRLLKSNNKYEARQAFDELSRVKEISPNYKDINVLMDKAYALGQTYVEIDLINTSQMIVPVELENRIRNLSVSQLNSQWVKFTSRHVNPDYRVRINLRRIDISPEQSIESRFTESKEIEDGFNYQLDNKGNVMKGSDGKDIKIKKVKVISCTITEITQKKAAKIDVTTDIIDNTSNNVMKSAPGTVETFFVHNSALASGDVSALKPESKKKIGSRPLPFPSNEDLVLQSSDKMNKIITIFIQQNQKLFN